MPKIPINLRLEEALLAGVDAYAKDVGVSRTFLFEEMLRAVCERRFLVEPPPGPNPFPVDTFIFPRIYTNVGVEKRPIPEGEYRAPSFSIMMTPEEQVILQEAFKKDFEVARRGCWLRPGANPHKYTTFGSASGHRYSYALFKGPVGPGLFVLHDCDVKGCVNPDHLFLGSHWDSMADLARKGASNPHRRNGPPWNPKINKPDPNYINAFPADYRDEPKKE